MNSIQKLKKLADILIEDDSVKERPRIIRKEIMVPTTIEVCPCCQEEIREKSMHCPDDKAEPRIWRHSCGGLMRSSKEAEKEAEEALNYFRQ